MVELLRTAFASIVTAALGWTKDLFQRFGAERKQQRESRLSLYSIQIQQLLKYTCFASPISEQHLTLVTQLFLHGPEYAIKSRAEMFGIQAPGDDYHMRIDADLREMRRDLGFRDRSVQTGDYIRALMSPYPH